MLEPKSGAARASHTTSEEPAEEPQATPPAPPPAPTTTGSSARAKRKLGDGDPFHAPAPTATTKKRSLGDGQSPW